MTTPEKGFLTPLTLVIFLLLSCSSYEQQDEVEKKPKPKIRISQADIHDIELSASELVSIAKSDKTRDGLFGKFFCDRAEFYVVNDPLSSIYSARIISVTLSYLDGELRKSKYILEKDIAPELIRELGGKFGIVALDETNKKILDTEGALDPSGTDAIINPKLDHFEIRWSFGDKEVRYRVSRRSSVPFIYTHKVRNFEKELLALEKYC